MPGTPPIRGAIGRVEIARRTVGRSAFTLVELPDQAADGADTAAATVTAGGSNFRRAPLGAFPSALRYCPTLWVTLVRNKMTNSLLQRNRKIEMVRFVVRTTQPIA